MSALFFTFLTHAAWRGQSLFWGMVIIFCAAGPAGADFIIGPGEVKVKYEDKAESQFLEKYNIGTKYKTKNLRWNLNAVLYNPTSYDHLSYIKSILKVKTESNWWLGGEGRYSFRPACDHWEVSLFANKRNRKSWSVRLWNDGEWRRTNSGYTLDEYSFWKHGINLRWVPWDNIRLQGELQKRVKEYRTSPNSWTKYDLVTEGKSKYKNHDISVSYKETTGEYPENAWGNYWSNTWGVDWVWDLADSARLRLDHSRLFKKWGGGEERRENTFLSVLEYPRESSFTVGWMFGYKETTGQLIVIDETIEEEVETKSRIGLRIKKEFSTRNHRIRAEVFRKEKEDGEESGGLLIIRLNYGDIKLELGVAPQGGFNYSEEKGYWIKVRYYFT